MTTWQTDDQCPDCGTRLLSIGTGTVTTDECPACGWTITWQAGGDQ